MKFVLKNGVTREQAAELAKAMFEKCYLTSQNMATNSEFSHAFRILSGLVGAFANIKFCEAETFVQHVRLFLAASQGLGRSRKEGRILMHYCINEICDTFPDYSIFRVRDDSYSASIPILSYLDNWLACEDSKLEDIV